MITNLSLNILDTLERFATEPIEDTIQRFRMPFAVDEQALDKNEIQLRCPYTLRPPKLPVRGPFCTHERSFDLEAFLGF